MMRQQITIHDRRVIYLTFEEVDFPGWHPGDVVTSPLQMNTGHIYHFSGLATVEGVVQNASRRYDVQISHTPCDELSA